MEAELYLEQVKKINLMIINKLAERNYWYYLATDTTSKLNPVKVQSSNSNQKIASAMDSVLEIDSEIVNLRKKQKEIIEVIEQFPEDVYDVLHKKYVQYDTYDSTQAIADSRRISKRTVERLLRKGLELVEMELKKKTSLKYANLRNLT